MTDFPKISDAEYALRMKKAQKLAAAAGLDVLLVNSNEAEFANVRYFSNYWPIFEIAGVVIPPAGQPVLLIGPESGAYAKDRSKIPEIHLLREYREPADPDYPGLKVSNFTDAFAAAGVHNPKKNRHRRIPRHHGGRPRRPAGGLPRGRACSGRRHHGQAALHQEPRGTRLPEDGVFHRGGCYRRNPRTNPPGHDGVAGRGHQPKGDLRTRR